MHSAIRIECWVIIQLVGNHVGLPVFSLQFVSGHGEQLDYINSGVVSTTGLRNAETNNNSSYSGGSSTKPLDCNVGCLWLLFDGNCLYYFIFTTRKQRAEHKSHCNNNVIWVHFIKVQGWKMAIGQHKNYPTTSLRRPIYSSSPAGNGRPMSQRRVEYACCSCIARGGHFASLALGE